MLDVNLMSKGDEKMKQLFQLFITFAKIGGMTFGGGYSMLPFLQREIVEKNKWATEEEIMDYFAIGQCTPGVIAVNTATFIGYKLAGVLGGILATLGVIFPSLVIISIIAAFIRNFADIEAVQHAMNGIQICVCALILDATIRLAKKSFADAYCITIFAITIAVSLFTGISAVFIVIGAGLLGIIINRLKDSFTGKEADK